MLSFILRHKYYIAAVLNVSMICIAWINWHGVSQIFETPENIKSYTWLKAVNQEPKLITFKQSELPKGEILRAEQLYSISQNLATDPEQLKSINTYFKNHYLTNYQTLNSVSYLVGNYRVKAIRELSKNDWVTQGVAIDLQAIELIHDQLTSNWINYPLQATLLLPHIKGTELQLKVGSDINLRSSQAISLVHIELPKQDFNNASINSFTPKVVVIPLAQHINLTGQTKLISITPAKELNIQALSAY